MWKCVPEISNPIPIILDIILSYTSAKEARRAAEEAAMWRNLFWVAVIVIAVLAFIILKQHRIIVRKAAKEPEEL